MNSEIELRSEISPEKRNSIESEIVSRLPMISSKERLSVVFLGKIKERSVDVRVRLDSAGQAEVVIKVGDFHAHDRSEAAQRIDPGQFLGFVRIFSMFDFDSKVMRRRTKHFFSKENNYEIALVDAGAISYLEIERLVAGASNPEIERVRAKLQNVLADMGLSPIGEEEFNDLCQRLTSEVDWAFTGSSEDWIRLESEIKSFI